VLLRIAPHLVEPLASCFRTSRIFVRSGSSAPDFSSMTG
jgi:hypothetical protein